MGLCCIFLIRPQDASLHTHLSARVIEHLQSSLACLGAVGGKPDREHANFTRKVPKLRFTTPELCKHQQSLLRHSKRQGCLINMDPLRSSQVCSSSKQKSCSENPIIASLPDSDRFTLLWLVFVCHPAPIVFSFALILHYLFDFSSCLICFFIPVSVSYFLR